mgnify:CR=1 FL=1
MPNKRRYIIVDDESSNQKLLKNLLEKYGKNFEHQSSFDNLPEAEVYLKNYPTDIVFLDIEMPEKNGLELFTTFKDPEFITVVVSAYDKYALPAIKEGVFDYLLKPLVIAEMLKTLHKIEHYFMEKQGERVIKITENGQLWFRKENEILYLAANGAYTEIFFSDGQKSLQSKNLNHFQQLLDETFFIRLHNSYIINAKHLDFVNTAAKVAILSNGVKVPYSHRKKKDLVQFLNKNKN